MSEPRIIKASVFNDSRGWFSEVLKDFQFRQINMSQSKAGVFRGIHAQRGMEKAMWVASGKATIFAVNLDPNSLLFGKTIAEQMQAGDGKVFYAPWWWGRGFLAHENVSIVYATTDIYRPEHEIAISYFGIPDVSKAIKDFPLELIVSEKDLQSLDITKSHQILTDWKRVGDEIQYEELG